MSTDYGPGSARKPEVIAGATLALALTAYGMLAKRRTPDRSVSQAASPGGPSGIPIGSWGNIARRVARSISQKKLSFIAAGAAFNTFLAIPAAIAVLVSLSLLVLGTNAVAARLGTVQHLLPNYALRLLTDPHSRQTLGIGLLVSVGIDVWTVLSGSSCVLTALTLVYGEKNRRSFIGRQMITLVLAAIMVPFGVLSLVLIAVLPGVIDSLPLSWVGKTVISVARWPILVALFMTMLAATYRYAPHRDERRWQWASTGVVVATVVWAAGSAGVSFYVSEFLPYDESYGTLGLVMILLGWLNFTAFIILLGAQINVEIEQERQVGYRNGSTERPLSLRRRSWGSLPWSGR